MISMEKRTRRGGENFSQGRLWTKERKSRFLASLGMTGCGWAIKPDGRADCRDCGTLAEFWEESYARIQGVSVARECGGPGGWCGDWRGVRGTGGCDCEGPADTAGVGHREVAGFFRAQLHD